MIHKVKEGVFSISYRQMWLPGAYDSERTALYAFRFDYGLLQELQDSVNPGGVITLEMLKKEKPRRGRPWR